MVDPTLLVAAVQAALATIPGITVYDGYVPAKVPEAGGYILPYVVIWAGVGDNPPELPSDGMHSSDTLVWDFQTTVVGSNPNICRRVTTDVKTALTNLPAGTGRVRPNADGFNQTQPTLDPSVTPARFMLPTPWRLITN